LTSRGCSLVIICLTGRDRLQVGADFLQLGEVRAAAEDRRVQRLPDVVLVGQVAAAAVGAAMRKYLSPYTHTSCLAL
jgi:hypothetical protein